MSAYRAAKVYLVPPTTLSDRISRRVTTDARVGHETFFTSDSLGKSTKGEKLSDNWFYGFTERKSDLKTVKPQKLSIPRAKSASRETLDSYYKELDFVCLFLLLYVPCQQLWLLRDGQFT